ncbi:CDP-diacylglycerol--serine O-phosphatidyltransferase [Sansalvadorimonas sp. 2012CJ34-2]|uniref:CDP-diacylglycerol--serine O-phosphatidyltransferase n=1 Tax=Parendozoicomonas callyspongiae TaxID=2942213 RepID=A0ABT0PLZ1_9GAMM|nr:CDP-diacylglycerol--serine O-phosphatidyltransferase [Sansalvadorimonas sp. 2012CJ34-2]MCL6271747.1 CDP-diacylglycerol--serine O-phosphatidyltransferase [Sansalvadorimonas sp. 2012CJ34-2]
MDEQSDGKDSLGVDGLLPVDEHVEEVAEGDKKVHRKGVYLLPNLLTTGSLFCGFYAIVSVMAAEPNYNAAAIAIFVAMILDGLDGRVARLINAQSKFGAEYDSLSDMVSFGVAPALVSFSWALNELGKVGWMIAFIYAACAALRLARFNTQIETADKRYFTGLNSPSAAALVAGMVWSFSDFGVDGSTIAVALLAALITGLAGVLMVSNFRYHSFKQLDLRGRVPFIFIIIVVLIFAVVFTDPPRVLLIVFLIYACSGPVMSIVRVGGTTSIEEPEENNH